MGVTKYVETVGTDQKDTVTVTHQLGTEDVVVSVWEAFGGTRAQVELDVAVQDDDAVILSFSEAPGGNLKVVVIG